MYVSDMVMDPHYPSGRITREQISGLKMFLNGTVRAHVEARRRGDGISSAASSASSSSAASSSRRGRRSSRKIMSPGAHTPDPSFDAVLARHVLDTLKPIINRRLDVYVGVNGRRVCAMLQTECVAIVTEGLARAARIAREAAASAGSTGSSDIEVKREGSGMWKEEELEEEEREEEESAYFPSIGPPARRRFVSEPNSPRGRRRVSGELGLRKQLSMRVYL
ncbi:hypothetical protein BC829DRAFT_291468 [Chytridium lagenaria]|nr:hypothetical protein BC829DRAFT_291468 [Chytridium lagenaria]